MSDSIQLTSADPIPGTRRVSQLSEDFLRRMCELHPLAIWEWRDFTAAQVDENGIAPAPEKTAYPVIDKTGKLWGHLLTSWQESLDQGFLPLLGELLRLESRLAAAEERAELAEALALLDPLTGLANRRAWEVTLAAEEQRCRRGGQSAAIVCLDLDGLKSLNDQAGHATGDELLRRTADCLRASIRAHDHAARLGGDEFGILLVECAGECVPTILDRLRSVLDVAGVAATIGWAARTTDADLLKTWQAADQAMIAAKKK